MEANSPAPEALWSIARIAERDGVSKPTVSNHVARLVERHGLYVTRDARDRVATVNVVQYDALRAQYADPSKVQAPRPAPPGELPLQPPAAPSPNNSYDEANRQKAWLDTEKRRLELAELQGKLLRADRVLAAIGQCCDEVNRIVGLLPQEADALAAEMDFDDVHRVRLALKGLALRTRKSLSAAFEAIEAGAPATEAPAMPGDAGDDEDT